MVQFKVEYLTIHNNNITNEGGLYLADAFLGKKLIKQINLSMNFIRDQAVSYFCDSFLENLYPNLQCLTVTQNQISEKFKKFANSYFKDRIQL